MLTFSPFSSTLYLLIQASFSKGTTRGGSYCVHTRNTITIMCRIKKYAIHNLCVTKEIREKKKYLKAIKMEVSEAKVAQSRLTLCYPINFAVHGIVQARIMEWVAFPFSRGSWIKPRSPTVRMDSLPAEPQGKPKNTGVGGLSLFQRIFLT